jgi:hypothetical protein
VTILDVRLDLDARPWPDMTVANTMGAPLERIGLMRNGTVSGKPTVFLIGTLSTDAGDVFVAFETTYRLLRGAMRAFAATSVGILLDEEDGL